jgi:hypothetical protein
MTSGAPRLMLVIGLVVGLFAGAFLTASAGPPAGPDCLFFPWVPNGVEIEDPDTAEVSGPYYGALRIQNLENEQISVFVMPFDHCDTANPGGYYQMGIAANAAIAFGMNEFIPEGTGGGLAVVGRLASDNSQPARIAGVQRQSSPTPLSSSIFSINTHETVSGYTALSEVGVAGQVYLPIVQTNNNWNTLVRATNFDRFNNANIHITLREAATGVILGPFFHLTGPGETATFDLRALGVPADWVGSATVTGGLPIGAVAERIKVETSMLLMNVSRSDDQVEAQNSAALIFRNWHHWNTGVSIANMAGVPNDINITFHDLDGDIVHNEAITIPANGMDFVYLPAGDESPFVGSAIIEGTEPFHGAVDEVKYFGEDGDTGHAMSYTTDYRVASEGEALALPIVWKPSPSAPTIGETTGIQIFNPTNDSAEVEVMFYDALTGDPALASPIQITIPGLHGETVYILDVEDLPTNFRGTAVVTNTVTGAIGDPGIVAVSNLVNYDVQFDGSSSFNLTQFIP